MGASEPRLDQERSQARARWTRREVLQAWWVLPVAGTAGFFGWLGLRATRILFLKRDPGAAQWTPGAARGVANVRDFNADWAIKSFTYAGAPGLVMRTPSLQPGGLSTPDGRHFLALSRVCTHLGCLVQFQPDSEATWVTFNYRPDPPGPVLACACHNSAFDPARAGRSVAGPAIAPLPRFRLQERGGQLLVTGVERT